MTKKKKSEDQKEIDLVTAILNTTGQTYDDWISEQRKNYILQNCDLLLTSVEIAHIKQ